MVGMSVGIGGMCSDGWRDRGKSVGAAGIFC